MERKNAKHVQGELGPRLLGKWLSALLTQKAEMKEYSVVEVSHDLGFS